MAKPSLIQTLLNKPSRTYAGARTDTDTRTPRRPRDLHSVRAEMQRAAAEFDKSVDDIAPIAGPSNPGPHVSNDDGDSDSSDDVFFTPNTSPRVSANGDQFFVSATTSMESLVVIARPLVSSSTSTASAFSSRSSSSASDAAFSTFSWDGYSDNSLSRATTPTSFASDDKQVSRSPSPSASSSHSRRRTRPPQPDWAKDVRWLVPPQEFPSEKEHKQTNMAIDTPHRRTPSTSRHEPVRASIAERMSALWEEDEGTDEVTLTTTSPHRVLSAVAAPSMHSRSRTVSAPGSIASPTRRRRSASVQSGRSHNTTTTIRFSQVVELPVPLPVSDGGTSTGYTSLVLPRAGPPIKQKRASGLFSHHGNSSSIDITRSGLAQTTMSTISLTKDSATARSRKLLSFSNNAKLAPTPAHLLATMPSPVSFTSHTSPPNKVQSTQVLVKVWAVGLDALDDVIVQERAGKGDAYGFVPGRSFVGRVIECGYDVDAVVKSDWVMGLLDMRKCGALSEFVLVEKRRLTRCPRPNLHPDMGLTLEQLALLPLCGIPAHRAVRTCAQFPRGSRALVLQAHTGAGALALQELAAKGVRVTAQVNPGDTAIDGEKEDEKDVLLQGSPEERAWGYGASEVVADTPVAAINAMHESEFDFVVDTAGGRRVWDASRRVLHSTGQFTTLVGDSSESIPSFNTVFKSNMRSLRRAFVKKDRKSLGYAWIAPVADVDGDGEDVRDSLVAVAKLAAEGVLRPYVDSRSVLPFEKTPGAFVGGALKEGGMLAGGRTAVVRIVN